jgi:hypothetical protein
MPIEEKNNNWDNNQSDPISDINDMIKLIESQKGIGRPLSIHEALYSDAQNLYMMGYNSEQVNYYINFIITELQRMIKDETK